jgi:asparagine synthase (glutamine-hydrolysing)
LCGLAGFTHSRTVPDPSRIRDAVGCLLHRGPDQHGVWESPTASLGAARLKIVDLASGDQPLLSPDGRTVIAFNGEVYNHAELRTELEHRGHHFRTRSDTETVLAAFLEWDTGCFARLRGMFAVAFWTESAHRLVLARDRMGVKPLYIARHRGELYFGSEIKAIFAHPEIKRRLSLAGLDCFLSLNYVPCPWTLVEGVEKLPPAHWLEWSNGVVRSEAYWRLPDSPQPFWTLDAAKCELDSLLKQSMREHLLADVPLGVWLSGGVASSTILHYAASAASGPLKTFSISFAGRTFDESAYIRQMVSVYGSDHQQLDLNPQLDLPGAVQELALYFDEPVGDAGALPVWFLSRLTHRSATVALSGEGADELFGGYLTYRADRLAQVARRFPGALLGLAARMAGRWPVSDEKIGFEYSAKRFLEGCQLPPEESHVYWNGAFSAAEKRSLTGPLPCALPRILAELAGPGANLPAWLHFDQKYYLPDDILAKVDRMSMAHSVEVRPPYLDHRIVEFAAALPPHLKISGARQKIVLKELMRNKLPPAILRRKKTGLDIPAHEWLRGPLRPFLTEVLETGAAEHTDLFHAPAIRTCLRLHFERRANLGYQLWGLMILFLWMKRWRIQTIPTSPASLETTSSIFTSV